jgi:hypothetical protein
MMVNITNALKNFSRRLTPVHGNHWVLAMSFGVPRLRGIKEPLESGTPNKKKRAFRCL